jgi:hypothetical protein
LLAPKAQDHRTKAFTVLGYARLQIVIGAALIAIGVVVWLAMSKSGGGWLAILGLATFGYDPDGEGYGS